MTCQNPGAACLRPAVGLYRIGILPTGTQRAFCADCVRALGAMGLVLTPVETGWVARALRSQLPTRIELGR